MIQLLLDTQTIILYAVKRLPRKVTEALAQDPPLFVSVVSPWEFTLKRRFRDLNLYLSDFWQAVDALGAAVLPIERTHILQSYDLPRVKGHEDPYDRMIISQALVDGMTLVGGDHRFPSYKNLKVLWR